MAIVEIEITEKEIVREEPEFSIGPKRRLCNGQGKELVVIEYAEPNCDDTEWLWTGQDFLKALDWLRETWVPDSAVPYVEVMLARPDDKAFRWDCVPSDGSVARTKCGAPFMQLALSAATWSAFLSPVVKQDDRVCLILIKAG